MFIVRFELWYTMHQITVSAIFLYMYFICMSYGSLSPYITHLHQDCMCRMSVAVPPLPHCMLHGVYMDNFTFFPFYAHFTGRKQFILHQSFSPVIYTPSYFHF
jgi:hypothetical protein